MQRLEPQRWHAMGVARVPYHIYNDPQIYAREQERIFCGKSWNYVGLSTEIPKPGDFIPDCSDFALQISARLLFRAKPSNFFA